MSHENFNLDPDAIDWLPINEFPTDPIVRRDRRHAPSSTADGPPVPPRENAGPPGDGSTTTAPPSQAALALYIYGQWEQEFGPAGSVEPYAIMGAAQHEARRRVIHDTIQRKASAAAADHRQHRRQPFLDKIEAIELSLRIWTIVRDDDFETGEGLQLDFPALLRDLDPNATPRNFGPSGEVREFVFLHGRAVASPRYKELHRKFANRKRIAESNLEAIEYRRLDARLQDGTKRLKAWIVGRIDRLIAARKQAELELAADDAEPDRPFAWEVETEEGRKMCRYHADSEAGVRRYMKLFDDHRRRIIRTDLRREQLYNRVGSASMYVGDIQVKVPPRYSAMIPRMQLQHLVMEFQNEMRFYPDRDPNEDSYVREIRERVGKEEFTAWNEARRNAPDGRTGGLGGSQRSDQTSPDQPPAG